MVWFCRQLTVLPNAVTIIRQLWLKPRVVFIDQRNRAQVYLWNWGGIHALSRAKMGDPSFADTLGTSKIQLSFSDEIFGLSDIQPAAKPLVHRNPIICNARPPLPQWRETVGLPLTSTQTQPVLYGLLTAFHKRLRPVYLWSWTQIGNRLCNVNPMQSVAHCLKRAVISQPAGKLLKEGFGFPLMALMRRKSRYKIPPVSSLNQKEFQEIGCQNEAKVFLT